MKTKKIGFVKKAHGTKGEVLLAFEDFEAEFFQELDFFYLEENQHFIPYFIEDFLVVEKYEAIVAFEDVETRDEALAISNQNICVDESLIVQKNEENSIIGFKVIDLKKGEIGSISKILKRKTQDLLEIENGEKTILLPFVEAFIKEIKPSEKTILIEVPEGLLDL